MPEYAHKCHTCQSRRQFLTTSLVVSAGLLLPSWANAGDFHSLSGQVFINGSRARKHSRIDARSTIRTRADSSARFVVGDNAFLLRPNSHVRFSPSQGSKLAIASLRLITGGLLSVFGSGIKKLHTPTATLGIRGTGVYMEAQDNSSYICLCYGQGDLAANNTPSASEALQASHHLAKTVSHDGLIEATDMRSHTDEELIMLEALVGRQVPFNP